MKWKVWYSMGKSGGERERERARNYYYGVDVYVKLFENAKNIISLKSFSFLSKAVTHLAILFNYLFVHMSFVCVCEYKSPSFLIISFYTLSFLRHEKESRKKKFFSLHYQFFFNYFPQIFLYFFIYFTLFWKKWFMFHYTKKSFIVSRSVMLSSRFCVYVCSSISKCFIISEILFNS